LSLNKIERNIKNQHYRKKKREKNQIKKIKRKQKRKQKKNVEKESKEENKPINPKEKRKFEKNIKLEFAKCKAKLLFDNNPIVIDSLFPDPSPDSIQNFYHDNILDFGLENNRLDNLLVKNVHEEEIFPLSRSFDNFSSLKSQPLSSMQSPISNSFSNTTNALISTSDPSQVPETHFVPVLQSNLIIIDQDESQDESQDEGQ
jgi:hypothetical protein